MEGKGVSWHVDLSLLSAFTSSLRGGSHWIPFPSLSLLSPALNEIAESLEMVCRSGVEGQKYTTKLGSVGWGECGRVQLLLIQDAPDTEMHQFQNRL